MSLKLVVSFTLLIGIINVVSGGNTLCSEYCDNRLASTLSGTFKFDTVSLFGRDIEVHGQREANLIFGRITQGSAGDEVWLDRSFDSGKSWDDGSRLGLIVIEKGASEATTGAFNVDSGPHKIGVLRACGKVHSKPNIACTTWHRIPICGTLCDDADSKSVTNPIKIDEHHLFDRKFEVMASTDENVIFGRLLNAMPGDEIWLDRSWDDGTTWGGGSRLGLQRATEEKSTVTTTAFNVDQTGDYPNYPRMAVLRVCVKVDKVDDVACTWWRRPPICDQVCDNVPSSELTESNSIESSELISRKIEVLASEAENAAIGRISNGKPGDEIWLDRSWDNGATWDSRQGLAMIPDGGTTVDTHVLNYDRRTPVVQVSEIRACGKAANLPDIVCTKWTKGPQAIEPDDEFIDWKSGN